MGERVPQSDLPANLVPPEDLPAGYVARGQLSNLQYRSANPPPSQPINPVEAGGILGGTLGMIFPPSAPATFAGGAALGGLVGTAAGASIGKSGEQLYKGLTGKKDYPSVGSVLGEYPSAVAEQAFYQLAGERIGAGVSKGLSMMGPALREGVGKAQELLNPKGGTLSLGQMGHSGVIEPLESFARSGVGGRGMFINLDKRNADALQAIKDDLIKSVSSEAPDNVAAGKIFQDTIEKGSAAHSIASQALYKDFDSRVGGAMVDSKPLADFGQELVDKFSRIGNVGKSDAGGRLIDQLKSIPNTMTFSDAQALRSNLLAQVRDLTRSGTETKALATAKRAAALVDESMNESAQALPDDLVKQFREINAFYRAGKKAFNSELINDLITKDPEKVGQALFQHGNVTSIVEARQSLEYAAKMDKTINKDAVFGRLQAGYLDGLLTAKAATSAEGETTAQNLLKTLAEAKTKQQFEVMFTEPQRQAIQDFARTAYLTLKNKPAGFGVLTSMIQASALGDLVAGSPVTGSPYKDIGILGSPTILAAIFTHPKAANIAANVLKSSIQIGTPAFTKYVASLNEAIKEK